MLREKSCGGQVLLETSAEERQGHVNMAFPNTMLSPPSIPHASFVKEDSVDSFKGCTAILEVGITLKSSLKQHRFVGILDQQSGMDVAKGGSGGGGDGGGEAGRRRSVQWIDYLGKDLAVLREFEPSDSGDGDEDEELDPLQTCTCTIQ